MSPPNSSDSYLRARLLIAKLVLRRCSEILACTSEPRSPNLDILNDVYRRLDAQILPLQTASDSRRGPGLQKVLVDDVAVNSTVLVCSSCELLDRRAEQEKTLILSRVAQYLPSAQMAVADFVSDFESARNSVEALYRSRDQDEEEQEVVLWTQLTVDRIDRVLPSLEAQEQPDDLSSGTCSICMDSYQEHDKTRLFPSCQHL